MNDGVEAHHTMKVVCKRTGLSSHVIRVWEKRYRAVTPLRTPTNRRLYRDSDIERLQLLHKLTEAGHSIGQAARLPNDRLRSMLVETLGDSSVTDLTAQVGNGKAAPALMNQCLEAVRKLDASALEQRFEHAVVQLGLQGMLTRLAAPLSQKVGELWRSGEITAAHEHFLSAALRTFLGRQPSQVAPPASAPVIVIATPAGQLHELGAVIFASAAANLGWRVVYLGTSLPAAEIAGAATEQTARVVALSLVYPEDDPSLPDELRKLRHYLSADIEILVGGRAAAAYQEVLQEVQAKCVGSLEDVYPLLEELRGLRKGRGARATSLTVSAVKASS